MQLLPFHISQNCSCPEDCTTLSCLCARNSLRCWYDREGRLTKDFNYTEPPLIFECNRGCRCWKTCSNRVVQHGQSARIQIYKTKGRGWGVRACLDIPQGSFIWSVDNKICFHNSIDLTLHTTDNIHPLITA